MIATEKEISFGCCLVAPSVLSEILSLKCYYSELRNIGDLLPKAVRKQNEGCLIEPANNNVDYSCETQVHNQRNWEKGNILTLHPGTKQKLQIQSLYIYIYIFNGHYFSLDGESRPIDMYSGANFCLRLLQKKALFTFQRRRTKVTGLCDVQYLPPVLQPAWLLNRTCRNPASTGRVCQASTVSKGSPPRMWEQSHPPVYIM